MANGGRDETGAPPVDIQVCPGCREALPVEDFPPAPRREGPGARDPLCEDCREALREAGVGEPEEEKPPGKLSLVIMLGDALKKNGFDRSDDLYRKDKGLEEA